MSGRSPLCRFGQILGQPFAHCRTHAHPHTHTLNAPNQAQPHLTKRFRNAGEVATLSFSLAYAPPEVVRAFIEQADTVTAEPAMDVWALGVICYELFTGTKARSSLLAMLR